MLLSYPDLMLFIIEEMAGDHPLEYTYHKNYRVNNLYIRPETKKVNYKQYEWDITEETIKKVETFHKWMYNES